MRVTVIGGAGRRVLSRQLTQSAAGSVSWSWNGRNKHGRTVRPGAFRLRFSGRAGSNGSVASFVRKVRVAAGRR